MSTFFVSKAALRNLKQRAQSRVTGVSSSHLTEAVAAALGFNTNAALLAAFAENPTTEVQKPDNARLAERLRQFGYSVPSNLRVLPELQHSYSPFRQFPLRRKRGVRWTAWRNMMVAAINAGLEQRLFGLSPEEDWWPGANPENNGGGTGRYRFLFDGDMPAIASAAAIGGDELSINVLLCPKDSEIEADRCGGIESGVAFARGWLERRLGAWMMDGGEDFECRRIVQPRVAAVQIQPLGYSDQGSFIF
ncbi:MAG: hypothetical protein ACOY82_04740 [Pseudomonadota bacterium]